MKIWSLPVLLGALLLLSQAAAFPETEVEAGTEETVPEETEAKTASPDEQMTNVLDPENESETEEADPDETEAKTASPDEQMTNVLDPENESETEEADPEAINGLVRSGSCGPSWSEYNGRCFRFFGTPLSWAKAQRNCVSMQSNLASVKSFDEYTYLQDLIYTFSHNFKETWIGGSDAQEEGIWLWSDGSPFQYFQWCRGEPDNWRGKQHCLQMNYGASKCWDDAECRANLPYVCAKKITSCL